MFHAFVKTARKKVKHLTLSTKSLRYRWHRPVMDIITKHADRTAPAGRFRPVNLHSLHIFMSYAGVSSSSCDKRCKSGFSFTYLQTIHPFFIPPHSPPPPLPPVSVAHPRLGTGRRSAQNGHGRVSQAAGSIWTDPTVSTRQWAANACCRPRLPPRKHLWRRRQR